MGSSLTQGTPSFTLLPPVFKKIYINFLEVWAQIRQYLPPPAWEELCYGKVALPRDPALLLLPCSAPRVLGQAIHPLRGFGIYIRDGFVPTDVSVWGEHSSDVMSQSLDIICLCAAALDAAQIM